MTDVIFPPAACPCGPACSPRVDCVRCGLPLAEVAVVDYVDLLAEHDALKSQATQAGRDVARLKAELATAREERVSLEAVIADQRGRLAEAKAEHDTCHANLYAATKDNDRLTAELAAAREALRALGEIWHADQFAAGFKVHGGVFEKCVGARCAWVRSVIARAALASTPPREVGEQGEVERLREALTEARPRICTYGCKGNDGPSWDMAEHWPGCLAIKIDRALTARTGGAE